LGDIELFGSVWSVGPAGNTFDVELALADATASYSVTVDKSADDGPTPGPTLRCVPYGSHWQQVLDFYRAPAEGPTPLLVQIHGGGWQALDKANTLGLHDRMLDAGISFASINYRFIRESVAEKLFPPVRGPLQDAARAVQFLRYHADYFGIEADRIGAVGGSAGGCSSVWLALHADMANPGSPNPIERESTRLWCAGGVDPQTSLDPAQMREWIPDIAYGAHAFGIFPEEDEPDKAAAFERFLAARPALLGYIREYSPYEHARGDAPPIYCSNPKRGLTPMPDEKGWPTHAPQFGSGLKRRLDELGGECYHHYKGGPSDPFDGDIGRFFIEVLKRSG
jgi:acetyl esterase/lipase